MKFAVAALPLLSVALAQSSSGGLISSISSVLPSATDSASMTASASMSGSASMTSSGSSMAPSQSGGSDAYLQQVIQALTTANLTSLVGVASSIATTEEGMALFSQLAEGNHTVFAPNDNAFSSVPESVSSNTTMLTQILAYHILNNTYTASGVQVSPMHTIARTLLRGGQYELPGNRSAPVVLTRNSSDSDMFMILNESNVTAMGPITAANLQIYIIDTVLTTPPTLGTIAGDLFPQLAGVIQGSNLLDTLEMSEGLTIFAPNDAAVGAIASALPNFNETTIQTLLANHVINGTAVYSDRLTDANYTSAAGEPFMFMSNDTGTYVMSGNSTAMIVRTDIIYNKGVVHVIDGVLVNTMSNPEAASSAYMEATAMATSQEPTGAMTQTSSPAASGSGSSSSAPNGASRAQWNFGGLGLGSIVAAVGVVLGGGAVLM